MDEKKMEQLKDTAKSAVKSGKLDEIKIGQKKLGDVEVGGKKAKDLISEGLDKIDVKDAGKALDAFKNLTNKK